MAVLRYWSIDYITSVARSAVSVVSGDDFTSSCSLDHTTQHATRYHTHDFDYDISIAFWYSNDRFPEALQVLQSFLLFQLYIHVIDVVNQVSLNFNFLLRLPVFMLLQTTQKLLSRLSTNIFRTVYKLPVKAHFFKPLPH